MSRISDIVAEIQAIYPTAGATVWMEGEENDGKHHNWNRIVWTIEPGEHAIGLPTHGAHGERSDAWVFSRRPTIRFSIWASNRLQAENRLHALLVACEQVLTSCVDTASGFRERWWAQSAATAGSRVDLLFELEMRVLASDVNVVQDDADPGAGFPLTPVAGATLTEVQQAVDGQTEATIATVAIPAAP